MRTPNARSTRKNRLWRWLTTLTAVMALSLSSDVGPRVDTVAQTQGRLTAYVLHINPDNSDPNNLQGKVAIFDVATSTLTGSINYECPLPRPCQPQTIAASPNGRWLYVTNAGDHSVSAIQTGNNTVTMIPLGSNNAFPVGIAVSPDGGRILPGKFGLINGSGIGAGIGIINGRTNTVLGTSIDVQGSARPTVVISPDGQRAYASVVTGTSVSIAVVDLNTNQRLTNIPVGNQTFGLAVSPDSRLLYAVDTNGNLMYIIDTTTNKVATTIPAGNRPDAVAVSPDGSRIYIAHLGGEGFWVVDATTLELITKIPTPNTVRAAPKRIAITPDGSLAYVVNRDTNNITVIDLKTNSVRRTISDPLIGPASIVIVDRPTEVAEREPNGSMAQAQAISPASVLVVRGGFNVNDEDFFSFDARVGQQLILDVDAQILGSPADTILTLFDGIGTMIAENNDFDGSKDSYLTFTVPSDGKYFISVKSSNPQQGGFNFTYQLVITLR